MLQKACLADTTWPFGTILTSSLALATQANHELTDMSATPLTAERDKARQDHGCHL